MDIPPLAGKIAALSLGALPVSYVLNHVSALSQCVRGGARASSRGTPGRRGRGGPERGSRQPCAPQQLGTGRDGGWARIIPSNRKFPSRLAGGWSGDILGCLGPEEKGCRRSELPHGRVLKDFWGIPRDAPSTGSKVVKGQSIAPDKALMTQLLLPHTRPAPSPKCRPETFLLFISCSSRPETYMQRPPVSVSVGPAFHTPKPSSSQTMG